MKQDAIKHLLPGVFQQTLREGNPLAAILEVMEALHTPSEEKLQTLDANFDPRRAPDKFVPFLARWVDLERLFDLPLEEREFHESKPRLLPTGLGRLRELIAAAAYLSQWRGTRKGLMLFLETATGGTGFEIEERVTGPDGRPMPFHFRVRAPQSVVSYRTLIERIIESEKPAYDTFELTFAKEKGERG
jgi:phage tail-like protein